MSDRGQLSTPKPDYRIGRISMLTLVSGATAFGLSGNILSALFSLLAGPGTALSLGVLGLLYVAALTAEGIVHWVRV